MEKTSLKVQVKRHDDDSGRIQTLSPSSDHEEDGARLMDRRGTCILISSDLFPSNPNPISPAAGGLEGIKELLPSECDSKVDSTQPKHLFY